MDLALPISARLTAAGASHPQLDASGLAVIRQIGDARRDGRKIMARAAELENAMDRAQKSALVAELNRSFSEVGVVVVTRNLGLTVAQSTVLRTQMRAAGASYKVSKNKLARIALDGTDYLSLGEMLTGPVGLATSIDPVAAAKVAVDFAKTNDKFEIVGGAMGGVLLDVDGVKALATLPSLDELRARIVGLLVAPAQKLASLTQAPAAQLARVFAAYADKSAGADETGGANREAVTEDAA